MAEPTDVTKLELPPGCREWLKGRSREETVLGHCIRVNLDWWNRELDSRRLPGGPVQGIARDGTAVTSGRAWICRRALPCTGRAGGSR